MAGRGRAGRFRAQRDVGGDGLHGVRLHPGYGAAGVHGPGLSPVPLQRLREGVQQAQRRAAEPGAIPSDVIAPVVLWRLRYRPTLRDLAERFLQRGFVFSHEAVRDWEAKLAPVLADELRRRRRDQGGAGRRSRHVDETYVRVRGRWCFLYRAIDRNGDLVDTLLSEQRDMASAKAFLRSAKSVTGMTPGRVTTDGHRPYPRAIRSTLGEGVEASDQSLQEQQPGAGPLRHQRPDPM
ncbi:IS6 family transposase [Roseomonas sp. GCM10028921]